jgi:hypothetical protein
MFDRHCIQTLHSNTAFKKHTMTYTFDNIYTTPEHTLLRDQVAKFISREKSSPLRKPGKTKAWCRARCCARWAKRACWV